jgi:hypothetical protein
MDDLLMGRCVGVSASQTAGRGLITRTGDISGFLLRGFDAGSLVLEVACLGRAFRRHRDRDKAWPGSGAAAK